MQKPRKAAAFRGFDRISRQVLEDPLSQSRRACLSGLFAQLDQAEQDFVALRLQLLDGARSGLGMDAVDELLLHFRS